MNTCSFYVFKFTITTIVSAASFVGAKDIYGLKGGLVLFVCPYTGQVDNTVNWYKVDINKTYIIIYSINDRINNQTLEPDIYTRLSIISNVANKEYNLQIRDIRESDEGIYRCIVNNLIDNQALYLIVPPSNVSIMNKLDGILLGTEGQELMVSCVSRGGNPPPNVKLQVNGNTLNTGIQTVTYRLLSLNRSDDRKTVICQASNDANVDNPVKDSALLYLNLKPSQPTFNQDPISIDETKQLYVSCTSTGSRPAATFQWTLGQVNIASFSSTQATNTGDGIYTVISTLRLNMDRTYNEQFITCTAGNIAATHGTSKILDVKFAPIITVTNVNYDQNIAARTVTCNPDGNPTNYTYYRWQHKSTYGVLIRELAGVKFLTLPSVPLEARYQDSGEYVCIAGNGITGRDGKTEQSGHGYVIINAQPVFTNGNNPIEYGEFRKDVDIHIYVYSVPKYKLVVWSKSSTTITSGDKYNLDESLATVTDTFHNTTVTLNGYRFKLTIKNLVDSDFNVNYSLLLSNDVGTAVYTSLLVSSSGPETPANFTISSSSQSSISVQWIPGYNGGHEQKFYLQYRVHGNSIWNEYAKIVDAEQTMQTYTLHGLQDGTLYELRMLAENKFNKSSPTQTERIETLKADASSQQSQMGPIIGGVAGGLVAVLVIILIIWFMIFRRKQDKIKSMATQEYETLGMQDNPNAYSELRTVQDQLQTRSAPEYETLGVMDNPNTYSELHGQQSQKKAENTADHYELLPSQDKYNVHKITNVQQDKIKSMATQEYENLGMQDNPNTYSELGTVQDQLKTRSAPEYETLGVMDNPNIYSELHGQQSQKKAENTADHYESLPNQDKYNVYKKTNVQQGLEHSEYANLQI